LLNLTLVNIFRKPIRELFNEFDGKDYDEDDFGKNLEQFLTQPANTTLKSFKFTFFTDEILALNIY